MSAVCRHLKRNVTSLNFTLVFHLLQTFSIYVPPFNRFFSCVFVFAHQIFKSKFQGYCHQVSHVVNIFAQTSFFCSIWASFSDLFKIWTIGGSKRKNHGRMTWSKSCIYKMMISKWTNCINKIVKYSAPNLLLTKNELDWRKERLNRNHSHVSAGLSVSVVCYVSNSCSVSMFHCFVFVIVTVVFAFHFFLFSFVILHSVRLFGALRTVAFQRLDRKFM